MSAPLLSVCIPHIGEPWLDECVQSIHDQGFGTAIQIVAREDKERRGAGATRNRCIADARAPYLMHMDADDLLPAGTIEPMMRLATPGVIVSTARVQFFNEDGLQHRWTWYETLLDPHELLTMPHTPIGTGNLVYPAKLHQEIGGYPTDCGAYESWAFFARAVLAGYAVTLAPGTEYLHRLHPDSYWGQRTEHRQADLAAALMYVYRDRLLG